MSFGVSTVPSIRRDTTDRNRTSPFAFTGNKFEFRMVGSSQNIALANIILNTAVARVLSEFADELEAAESFEASLTALIEKTFREHQRILFLGNSYTKEWETEAEARGLSNYKNAPEAYAHFTDPKNVELFSSFGVMNESEMNSRREILFESYRKIKNIEARTMVEMTLRDFIPAVSSYVSLLSESVDKRSRIGSSISSSAERELIEKLSSLIDRAYSAARELERVEKIAQGKPAEDASFYFVKTVIPKMDALRTVVDTMESLTAREYWPMPTYGDILFSIS
jgi:glutamine synthetase